MPMKLKLGWLTLAASSLWLALPATAGTAAESTAATTDPAAAAVESHRSAKMTDKKLKMIIERIPRRIAKQNPAR